MVLKRSAVLLSLLCLFLTMTHLYRKGKAVAYVDSLRQLGLTDEEIRIYLYLLALQTISTYYQRPTQAVSAEHIRKYIEDNTAAQCPTCERWFLDEVAYCPFDHKPTDPIDHKSLVRLINDWEAFRSAYSSMVKMNRITCMDVQPISRVTTIRLHYYSQHSMEG